MESHESGESVPLENLPKPPSFDEGSPPAYVEVQQPAPTPGISLRWSHWPLGLAVFYSFFALFSWVVLCLLRTKPLSTSTYAYHEERYWLDDYWQKTWGDNEKWFLTARICQAIAGLSVIPISSAVCANAAAVYAQRNHITLKQLLFIADGTYASPLSYLNLITNGISWVRKNGSIFWACAALLHIIGAAIWPIQAGLVSPRVIKVQGDDDYRYSLVDLGDLNKTSEYLPGARHVAMWTARAMEDYEWYPSTPHLWVGGTCPDDYRDDCADSPSLERWTTMPDPFFAELPSDSNTGLRRQFAPRVNFTTEFTCLNRSTWEWPAECDDEVAMLFDYNDQTTHIGPYAPWSIRVCMPPDSTSSPWKATRDRQDFKETLYLNATGDPFVYHNEDSCLAKIEVKTTAGMFEMPNHMNDDKPGPLLAKSPIEADDSAAKRDAISNLEDLRPFLHNNLPGPLYAATLGLFGLRESFVAQCIAAIKYDQLAENETTQGPGVLCSDSPPLSSLLSASYYIPESKSKRWEHSRPSGNSGTLKSWLGKFQLSDTPESALAMENTFSSAAFFATSAIFKTRSYKNLDYHSNAGMDTIIPEFSFGGLIAVSVLLGLYLLGLWGMAMYAYRRSWTPSLDSFAILRIGARLGEHIPLKLSYKPRAIAALDHLPGWVGEDVDNDTAEDERGRPARLAVGSERGLRSRRAYECYPGEMGRNVRPTYVRQTRVS